MERGPANALVTGGARRLGRAIVRDLVAHGWNVAIHHHRSAAAAAALTAEVEGQGVRAVAIGADLAAWDEGALLVTRAAAALGPITLLINNAAVFELDRPGSVTHASWDRHINIDLRAPLILTQGLLAQLPAGGSANVINLIDQRAVAPTPNYTSYSVAKMGLLGLTRHLAIALAPAVRVNAIGPGVIDLGPEASEEERAWARSAPLGRGPDAAEVCRTLQLILRAPSLTGQMITLDGGQHLGWLPGAASPARP